MRTAQAGRAGRLTSIMRIVTALAVTFLAAETRAQLNGNGLIRSQPQPLPPAATTTEQAPSQTGQPPVPPPEQTQPGSPAPAPVQPQSQAPAAAPPVGAFGVASITATAVGRGAAIVDTTQLASFASGTFMPAAIPVRGENFYSAGERAMIQGSGSAIQLTATGQTAAGDQVQARAMFVAAMNTPEPTMTTAHVGYVDVQYLGFVAGLTDTAFGDPDSVVQTIDVEGPNAIATTTGPTGAANQGRLGYVFDFSDNPYLGYIGQVSLESPTPEIEYASGMTPATTFSKFSRVPDLVTTLKYVDGELTPTGSASPYVEYWHVQLGSVVRDLCLENGNRSIDDSAFGWGVQLSGAFTVFDRPACGLRDIIAGSVVYGEGMGHYINDLHVSATSQTTGGNDAILDGTRLEALPVLAFYAGYEHEWTSTYVSHLVVSRVVLDGVPGQVPNAYHTGDYAAVNLLYHVPAKLTTPGSSSTIQQIYVGAEYLYGVKEELSGQKGSDQRIEFMLSFTK